MNTRVSSYVRFLVQWMGRRDYENSWISEEEFMNIDAEKCQAVKMVKGGSLCRIKVGKLDGNQSLKFSESNISQYRFYKIFLGD